MRTNARRLTVAVSTAMLSVVACQPAQGAADSTGATTSSMQATTDSPRVADSTRATADSARATADSTRATSRTAVPSTSMSMALDTATFGGGCFWCMEPPFDKLKGVLSTTSGYTGGTVKNPTYEQVSDGGTRHVEVVQVVLILPA